MFKKSCCLLALIALGMQVQAQEKINVAFIPTTFNTSQVNSVQASTIHETLVNSFVSAKRFTVVDRTNLKALEDEKKLQRTEAFMDSKETFTDGVSKGASYLVEGAILSVDHKGKKDKWTSDVALQLKILNVSTGEIVTTETVTTALNTEMVKGAVNKVMIQQRKQKLVRIKELSEIKESSDAAFRLAMQRLVENVQDFATANFPIHLELVEWVGKDMKTKVAEAGPFKNVVIAAGSNFGMQVGQVVDIAYLTEVTVNGKVVKRQNKVAKAMIAQVDDANFSTAQVIDGEKEVKNAILKQEKLIIITQ